jgi:hypothetical protein
MSWRERSRTPCKLKPFLPLLDVSVSPARDENPTPATEGYDDIDNDDIDDDDIDRGEVDDKSELAHISE